MNVIEKANHNRLQSDYIEFLTDYISKEMQIN